MATGQTTNRNAGAPILNRFGVIDCSPAGIAFTACPALAFQRNATDHEGCKKNGLDHHDTHGGRPDFRQRLQ